MKVLALVPYSLGSAPGQRYRYEQWAPYLKEQGIELTFRPFSTSGLDAILYKPGLYATKGLAMLSRLVRRAFDAWEARDFDVVLVQREACLIGPAWAERVARIRRPAFVYDFDDAIYMPYVSPTHRHLSYLKFPWKTASLCRMAHMVVAGSPFLAEWARQHNPRVHLVPSTVSLRSYVPRPGAPPPGRPVVGWTGSHSSVQYLLRLAEPLRRLGRRVPFRLLVIGGGEVNLPGVEVESRPWRSETEVQDLWDMDIGIMPLPDEPWAHGKCGMKAIQYMGVGLPAVVSPIGVNRNIVTPGIDGDHATTDEEWLQALERLLRDDEVRRRMGAAAYRTVTSRFSAEAHAPRVAALLRVASGQSDPGPAVTVSSPQTMRPV